MTRDKILLDVDLIIIIVLPLLLLLLIITSVVPAHKAFKKMVHENQALIGSTSRRMLFHVLTWRVLKRKEPIGSGLIERL